MVPDKNIGEILAALEREDFVAQSISLSPAEKMDLLVTGFPELLSEDLLQALEDDADPEHKA